mgnify:CR=1 FL=1
MRIALMICRIFEQRVSSPHPHTTVVGRPSETSSAWLGPLRTEILDSGKNDEIIAEGSSRVSRSKPFEQEM